MCPPIYFHLSCTSTLFLHNLTNVPLAIFINYTFISDFLNLLALVSSLLIFNFYMAIKFEQIKVSKIIQETPDTISMQFDIIPELKDLFQYLPGQYLTIRLNVNGKDERRAYSISSCPVLNEPLQITIKNSTSSPFLQYITTQVKQGDFLQVMPPLGNFTLDPKNINSKYYVMIAGGSGIAPIFSIIKTLLYANSNCKVYLFYSNKHSNNVIFKEQLDNLISIFSDRFRIFYFLTQESESLEHFNGRINTKILEDLINEHILDYKDSTQFYICGPQGLMDVAEQAILNIGIDKDSIHKESFTAPLPQEFGEEIEEKKPKIIKRKVRIKLYGDDYEFEVEPDDTVITAAIFAGIDPPYSCQIGACSTCRAKLVQGKVFMDEREALSDDEIKMGYILTCQSHPLTDDVYIDYDY